MLDIVIRKHIDSMDSIALDIDTQIDKLMKSIDIDAIMENPQDAMIQIGEAMGEILKNKIIPNSVNQGHQLAATIEKLRKGEKIEIPDTENPTLNKELADDKRRD